ncbi:MAG: metallophosphoesterase [Clostridia bacterium]|nr:metallophosphoesterase [Clostridia bacterium]
MAPRNRYVFAVDCRPHRGRRFFLAALLILLVLLGLFYVGGRVASRSVQYEKTNVVVPDLPEDLRGFSILHVSDLHGETYGQRQAAIASAVGNVGYSCAVITGDMLGPNGEYQPLLDLISALPDSAPIYYLPGDEDPDYLDSVGHGTATPFAAWAELLASRGVTILDRPVLFTRGRNDAARLWLIPDSILTMDCASEEATWQGRMNSMVRSGGSDAGIRVANYQLERIQAIRKVIEGKQILETDILVLVTHVPLTEDTVNLRNENSTRSDIFATRKASLVLSGHLCGGQFRLPFLGAVWVPGLGNFPEDDEIMGLTWASGVPQHISPGLGASSIYPWWASNRFFNPPVITKLVLTNSM